MLITCKILSKDFLISRKIESFIKETPFFYLEEKKELDLVQVLFWDIDTINIEISSIKTRISEGCLVILISSIISKEIIFSLLDNNHIAIFRKNIMYSQFLEEISRLIDEKIQISNE